MPVSSTNFPNAASEGYLDKSCKTPMYNCIAWAVGESHRSWWPNSEPDGYWPPGIPAKTTVYAFLTLFRSRGYTSCANGDHETTFEKVAIYALDNVVKHAARQLPNGDWTSKIGNSVDIEHSTLRTLEGPFYGTVVRYLKRTFPSDSSD